MSDSISAALVILTALGSGLMAGTFFAFSVIVNARTRAVAPASGHRRDADDQCGRHQSGVHGRLPGHRPACDPAGRLVHQHWGEAGTMAMLAGALCYLVGSIAITMLLNVPLNNALAAADPGSAEGAQLWSTYLLLWTMWNWVRTIVCAVAVILLVMARQ